MLHFHPDYKYLSNVGTPQVVVPISNTVNNEEYHNIIQLMLHEIIRIFDLHYFILFYGTPCKYKYPHQYKYP